MRDATLAPAAMARRRFLANRLSVAGTLFLLALVAGLVAGPFLVPFAPNAPSDAVFQPPSGAHPFGTDIHGRDLLARCLAGTRVSLMAGMVGAAISVVIGTAYGLVSGYRGGRTDAVMMRSVDLLYALPNVIFAILTIGLVGMALDQVFARAQKAVTYAE